MNIAIALAQFIMLALATMAAHILVNSDSVASPPVTLSDMVATFIANQGLWFLLVPAIWLFLPVGAKKAKAPGPASPSPSAQESLLPSSR